MKFIDGKYQPGPHITKELLKFPEENLTVFVCLDSYCTILIISRTSSLNGLCIQASSLNCSRKSHHLGQAQTILTKTEAGHRILQTDASNEFWGAILIEKENEKKYFCGHASGQFKDSEKHYHAIYKEILAMKYGIKKFEFHLIGHHFTILMDNTSFSKIMDSKEAVQNLKNIREYAMDHMFVHLARLLSETDIPQALYYFPIEVHLGQMIHISRTPEMESPSNRQSQALTSLLSMERPKLVYTSLVIEPMDEDSDSDSIPEHDSQDPWDYRTEITLESPVASFHHGRPSASA
ncbi:UNVERIFIED_CONTAM: polyprotein [Sesamum latifolium]|uniref:Polyprotein n=1 Tax=Sesamum latifolium TaxID=2727402 RepID=A0AAW2XME4_9LAMI